MSGGGRAGEGGEGGGVSRPQRALQEAIGLLDILLEAVGKFTWPFQCFRIICMKRISL